MTQTQNLCNQRCHHLRICLLYTSILCDTSHQIEREGAQTLVFDKGADSVDFALVNRVKPGDIVAVSYTHLDVYKRQGWVRAA